MKKVSIIYWSNGGNVEILANAIVKVLILKKLKLKQNTLQMLLLKIY